MHVKKRKEKKKECDAIRNTLFMHYFGALNVKEISFLREAIGVLLYVHDMTN